MQIKTNSIRIITTKALTINLFLKHLINELKNDYEIILACSDPENITINKINKIKINFPTTKKSLLNFKTLILCILDIIKISKNKKDIYFIHTPVASIIFRLVNFFKNLNIVYFVHGFRFQGNKNFIEYLFLFVEYILSFKTKFYININKQDYKFTKKILKKKTILVNGVGVDIPTYKIKKKNKVLKACIISAYKRDKGYESILNQVDKIFLKHPDFQIDCYGYGNFKKEFPNYNLKKIKNFRINSFKKNINELIKKYDFLIHPSHREGLPVAVIQCMSFGLPVIGRNIRGVRDLIKNNYNGITFDDDKQILKCISTMLKTNKYNFFSKNSKKKINQTFSKQYISKKIKNYLNQIK